MSISTTTRLTTPALFALAAAALLTGASVITNISSAVSRQPDTSGQIVAGSIAGAVAILCAVSLAGALSALGRRQYVQACIAALAFTLSAAFSTSSALGVLGGPRLQSTMGNAHMESDRARLTDQRSKSSVELSTIPSARNVSEINPEIARILSMPKINGCTDMDGPITKQWCPVLTGLQTEKARAERISALHGTIARIDAELSRLGTPSLPNADAAAIAHVATALGMPVSVERINVALMLLGVVILEIGGGLSLAVASALRSPVNVSAQPIEIVPTAQPTATAIVEISAPGTILPLPAPMLSEAKMPAKRKAKAKRASRMSGEVAKVRVEEALRTLPANPSVRTVAAASKVPKSSVHAIMLAVSSVAAAGAAVNQFGGVAS